jgi:glycosyltransferase involved in cell wall biosynthesis
LSVASWFRGKRSRAPLRIVFIDPALDYTAGTPYVQPLGGSQSAVCYLAEALAAAGESPVLLSATKAPGTYRGVECLCFDAISDGELAKLRADVIVPVIVSARAGGYRRAFGARARLVVWIHHASDQPAVALLADAGERAPYDAIALVSEWQREQFVRELGVEPSRTRVIGNAIGPAFAGLFDSHERIGAAKARPPVLAYASTPFRGLDVLLAVFPEIRRRVPGARLKVFSSMRLYLVDADRDEAQFGELYRRCRETEGVEYVGALPQPELARELREATLLAYPNTYPETFCIAALEAMAAGCRVVTSELGALPETTAGYARLVPIVGRKSEYAADFLEAVVATLQESLAGSDEALLRAQVDYVNRSCTWDIRAREWVRWLKGADTSR